MHLCNHKKIKSMKNPNMRVLKYKYANIKLCKSASFQKSIMQKCKYESSKYVSMYICKYASMNIRVLVYEYEDMKLGICV